MKKFKTRMTAFVVVVLMLVAIMPVMAFAADSIFTTQPKDVTALVGGEATFSVEVSEDASDPHYQWKVDKGDGDGLVLSLIHIWRGYRVFNAKAPMRETLAAGLIFLSRWRDREFYDIMCGSGTIAIEAAMRRKNMAPGSLRGFDAEKWGSQWNRAFAQARQAAKDQLLSPPAGCIHAYDIDPKCVEMTRLHAKKAGVAELMDIRQADAAQFDGGKENATILSNPPYGMRLMEKEQIAQLMGQVGRNLQKREDLRYYFISGDPQFERAFGKKCDKKRKLYNGNLLCYFYQYFR